LKNNYLTLLIILSSQIITGFAFAEMSDFSSQNADLLISGTLGIERQLPESIETHALLVTHASEEYDRDKTAKSGIDKIIAIFKTQGRPIIYLNDARTDMDYSKWYTHELHPDYHIFSEGGEHNLPLRTSEVTVVGGFFGSKDMARGCHALTLQDSIRMHFEMSNEPFSINLPLDAIYFYEEDLQQRDEMLALNTDEFTTDKLKERFKTFASHYFLQYDYDFAHYYVPPRSVAKEIFRHRSTSTRKSRFIQIQYEKDLNTKQHQRIEAQDNQNSISNTQDDFETWYRDTYLTPMANKSYLPGKAVNLDHYTFNLFFNGILVSTFGTGTRTVNLKLLNSLKELKL
jgi:hypothetical protein